MVVATRTLTPEILEADLRMDDPSALTFTAGQWISVPFGPKVVRAWTMLSSPAHRRTITISVDVAPGGLGSLWGTLLGGMLLGVTQVLVSQVSVPYAILASQLLFLVVLAVRPQGLFGTPQAVG